MAIIFLLGAIQAFFFAILLWSKEKMLYAHKVLFTFFLLNGLILVDHYLEKKEIIFEIPHLLGITYTMPILLGPIIWYYTRSLVARQKPRITELLLPHALPFIILTLYFLVDFYFLSPEEKLQYYLRESQTNTSLAVYISEFFLIFSIPVYSVYSLLLLGRYKREMKNTFSYTEEINLRWLRLILYFFCFISIISLTTNLLSDVIPVISFHLGDDLIFTSLSAAIFFIGYFGIKQKAIYPETTVQKIEKNTPYQKSGYTISQHDPNIARILNLMDEEALYLNPRLSLKEFATEMKLTENHLSQLLNAGLNKSFYDFINEYRVDAVKEKIADPKYNRYTLLSLAFESGFNSKSTFNSIFKNSTGMTPSDYRKRFS